MARLVRSIAFVLLFITSALVAQSPANRDGVKGTQSRIKRLTYKFEEAGRDMEYGLFVPSSYRPEKSAPLLVALHGLGSNPQQILRYPGLTDLAEKYGYLVAAPMGYNERGWYGGPVLLKGKVGDPKNISELSEKDVLNVLDLVRKEYKVDPDRLYLMGHSMGGGGTWHLGAKYADKWAALAPIAPAPLLRLDDMQKLRHLPVILVQGADDRIVKTEWVRPYAETMKKLEMKHEYIEVPGGDHITVAFTQMPKIFEFLDQHKRTPRDSK